MLENKDKFKDLVEYYESTDQYSKVCDGKDPKLCSDLVNAFLEQEKLGFDIKDFFDGEPSEWTLRCVVEQLNPLHQGQNMLPDYKLLEQADDFLSILRKGNILDESNKKELLDLLDKLIQRFNAIVKMSSLKSAAENSYAKLLVDAKMKQVFSRIVELSSQIFEVSKDKGTKDLLVSKLSNIEEKYFQKYVYAQYGQKSREKKLGKKDLAAYNTLVDKLYKIFNGCPDRFVQTFGNIYEELILDDDNLLQFCEQAKSLSEENKKKLIYHIRDNLLLKGCRLSLETLYELNNLLKENIFCDDSRFSKIIREKNINWLEKIDVYDWQTTQKYDAPKLIEFMDRQGSKSVFIDRFIEVVKDKCDFSAFFSKEYFDINKLKSKDMKCSGLNSMIRALYMCFKYDKNKQDAVNTISDIFEHSPEGFLSVRQILALLDICNEFDVNIVITKDMFARLFSCLNVWKDKQEKLKMHDLLLICGFCENGAISGKLAKKLVSLVEPHSNSNGFKMSITPEADSYRYGNKRFTRPTRLDDSQSYYRAQFDNLTVNLFALMQSKFEDGFVFRGDIRSEENSYYGNLSAVFRLYCFESHVRVKHTRKTAIDFFRRYGYNNELIWIKEADEGRNLKQYFKDCFWYYPRFNFGKVYQKFDGFAKEISSSSEKLSVEDLMFLVFSNFKFGENSYMTEQEFRDKIPDEIDDPRYFLWLFRVYREQGSMTKDVFKSYINKYKISNLTRLDMCFSVLLDSLIDHDVELLNLILDNCCGISLSEEDRKSYMFREIEQKFLQLKNDGLTSRFYEKMGLARINEKKVWEFLDKENINKSNDTMGNALPPTPIQTAPIQNEFYQSKSLGAQNRLEEANANLAHLNKPDNNGDMTKTNINSDKDSGRTRDSFSPTYIQNESYELEPLYAKDGLKRDNLKNVNVSLYPLNKPDNNRNMTKTSENSYISDIDSKKYANTVNKRRSMLTEKWIKALIGFGIAAFIIGIGMIFAFLVFPELNFLLIPGLVSCGSGVVFFGAGALYFKQYVKNFDGYNIKNCGWYSCFSIFRPKSIFRENTIVYEKLVFSQKRNGTDQSKNKYEK